MVTTNKSRKVELSEGFFKKLAHGDTEGLQPVLQIMNSRLTNDGSSVRLRLNDGEHSYATILLRDNGFEKFKAYGMEKTHQSIIKLLSYSSNDAIKDGVRRMHLTINDFDLISKDSPLIGTPVPYSGNPNDYPEVKVENTVQKPLQEANSCVKSEEVNKVVKNIKKEVPEVDPSVVPILSISPYLMQWKIRGVVTEKSVMRDVTTPKGQSKVFSFSITDKEGTEIKMSAFGELATQLYELVQESESYIVKGNNKAIRSANKRFNATGHEYEVVLRNDIEITKCEPPSEMPVQRINRVSLNQIKLRVGDLIDVVAVVDNIEEPTDISTKRGMTKRRVVSLLDPSKTLVPLTIWGDYCNDFTSDMLHQPIILKNVVVTEFNGNCGLTYNFRTKIIPSDGAEAIQNLANWYANERGTMEIVNQVPNFKGINYSTNVSIHTAISLNKNNRDRLGGYFNIVARILRFKEDLVYASCIQPDCKKKVQPQDGQYYCSKCDVTSETFKYCFMVNVEIYDHSGSHWATMFGDKAANLLGKTANEVAQILEAHGESDGFNMITQKLINTIHNFNIRTRINVYNESEVFQWTIIELRPVNLAKYAEHLATVYKEADELCARLGC
uniref:Replication protein A subunit n=1 Tax=Strongyloides stercoralis TaxID=6248 RepID=A0A0K0EAJ6_STRER